MRYKITTLFIAIILLCGCQTKEQIQEKKEKERIDEITKEVEKNKEISEEAKKWLIDNKSSTVMTIYCISTSNRCTKIKENIEEFNKKIKIHYLEMDKIDDDTKNVYKTTYELENYTGYLPYILIVKNDKKIDYSTNIKDVKDIKDLLIKNKIVSE